MEERVKYLFGISIESKMHIADMMSGHIARAGQKLVDCLLNDGKLFLCGNGGSNANCLHFSAAMMNHFEVERPPLPVIALSTDVGALTSVTQESHYDQVFARQLQALGRENDTLITLSTSPHTDSLLHAVNAAHDQGMDVIALTGPHAGVLSNHLGPEDIELNVPGEQEARIREMHLFILHCFCDLIDQALFNHMLEDA